MLNRCTMVLGTSGRTHKTSRHMRCRRSAQPHALRTHRRVFQSCSFPPKKIRAIDLRAVDHAIEPLIGVRRIQTAPVRLIFALFEVIQQWKQIAEWFHALASAVQAGFQTVAADNLQCFPKLRGILSFAHEADAGDLSFVAAKQCHQLRKQRLSNILLEIRGMAAVTAKAAVGDGDRQTDFRVHFFHCHGTFHILERRVSHLPPRSGNSSRRRCARRPPF